MRLVNFLIVLVLCVSFSSAISVCIDRTSPSAPQTLAVTSSGMNIILTWGESTDEPSCSGIDRYIISRDGAKIGETEGNILTFNNENVSYGTYSYTVYAIDKAGHNSGPAIKNDVILSKPNDEGNNGGKTHVSGGSPSKSYVCEERWQCEDWSECINNEQMRICEDIAKCGTTDDKPSTYQECETEDPDITLIDVDKDGTGETRFSAITGAVVGAVSTPEGTAVTAFVVLALTSFLIIRIKKKKK